MLSPCRIADIFGMAGILSVGFQIQVGTVLGTVCSEMVVGELHSAQLFLQKDCGD